MENLPLLSILIFLPAVGAAFLLSIQGQEAVINRNARHLALWTSMTTFILALVIYAYFDPAQPNFQFTEQYNWLSDTITYHVGLDGISLAFILLTALLMPLCILASWESITYRVKEYMAVFLLLETLLLGVFSSLDLVLFYLFFEGGLIPMFLIIGIWGGPRRIYASFKFFLYTLAGSLLMLLAILAIYEEAWTTNIVELLRHDLPADMQYWLWIAFFASFAVKLPMWPFHTWLPDAHVEAPTAGSVILAGILLKLGGYGFLRFALPMMPIASLDFAPFIWTLSCIAIIYTSLVALAQEDIKKLIAYSSVAHMGFVTIGLFTASHIGIHGGVFQMLSHGWLSAALFLSVGILYDRMRTRDISSFGGVVRTMPIFSLLLMIFTLGNIGLPGTSGFVGEVLAIFAAFNSAIWVAAAAAVGVILSAAYALWLYGRVIFGEQTAEAVGNLPPLTPREAGVLAPLALATLLFGVYPQPIFRLTDPAIERIVKRYDEQIQSHQLKQKQELAEKNLDKNLGKNK